MAGSFNKVLLMGNLTRDVEMRHTSGNMAVAKFAIAVNRTHAGQPFTLPPSKGRDWVSLLSASLPETGLLSARAVEIFVERY